MEFKVAPLRVKLPPAVVDELPIVIEFVVLEDVTSIAAMESAEVAMLIP